MRNALRAALIAAASIGTLALSTAANAGAVTIAGGGTFTTSAGPSRTVAGSLVTNCSTTTTTTTIPNGIYTPPAPIGTTQLTFSGCRFQTPNVPVTVTCQPLGPAVVNLTGPPSLPVPGMIPWSVTQVDCTIAVTGMPTCKMRLTGQTATAYYNPGTFLGGTNGAFDFQLWDQAFTATNTSSPPCGLPAGPLTATIGSPVGSDLQHVLSTVGPTIS